MLFAGEIRMAVGIWLSEMDRLFSFLFFWIGPNDSLDVMQSSLVDFQVEKTLDFSDVFFILPPNHFLC